MLRASEKKYLFLRTRRQLSGSNTLMEKILIDTQADRYAADVYNLRGCTTSILVRKDCSRIFRAAKRNLTPKGFKGPENHWTSFYIYEPRDLRL